MAIYYTYILENCQLIVDLGRNQKNILGVLISGVTLILGVFLCIVRLLQHERIHLGRVELLNKPMHRSHTTKLPADHSSLNFNRELAADCCWPVK